MTTRLDFEQRMEIFRSGRLGPVAQDRLGSELAREIANDKDLQAELEEEERMRDLERRVSRVERSRTSGTHIIFAGDTELLQRAGELEKAGRRIIMVSTGILGAWRHLKIPPLPELFG